jgi:phage terminase large subunit-like protein
MKDHPVYGWQEEMSKREIVAIHFNSGVSVYFKTYSQNVMSLQTGTVYAIFCDEELPVDHYDELIFRITATDGYFHMVFTATLGQDFWRRCMEPEETEEEVLPEAFKSTVSLYDAQYYEDGSPSMWTNERIQIVKNRCKSDKEIQKRVFGRFVIDSEGLKYPQFSVQRHVKPYHALPKDWLVFSATDPGGGGNSHPAGILFLGVAPDFKRGRIFLGWRGDNIGDTTAGDVLLKHEELKRVNHISTVDQVYDFASKDFHTIATRKGLSFSKADKDHERGEQLVNVLFKNDMLEIYDTEELRKLVKELLFLRKATQKRNAKDNLADPLRYVVMAVPWDLDSIGSDLPPGEREKPDEELSDFQRQVRERRREDMEGTEHEENRINAEFEEWNEQYEA